MYDGDQFEVHNLITEQNKYTQQYVDNKDSQKGKELYNSYKKKSEEPA